MQIWVTAVNEMRVRKNVKQNSPWNSIELLDERISQQCAAFWSDTSSTRWIVAPAQNSWRPREKLRKWITIRTRQSSWTHNRTEKRVHPQGMRVACLQTYCYLERNSPFLRQNRIRRFTHAYPLYPQNTSHGFGTAESADLEKRSSWRTKSISDQLTTNNC